VEELRVSPDGHWIAYASNESGQFEVYVRPFPNVNDGRWQVSTEGGDSPLWSPDGRELFYRNGDSVMAVIIENEATFKAEKPATLFRTTNIGFNFMIEGRTWDIHPDGKRFIMIQSAESGESSTAIPRQINIVLNWFEELKQKVPVD
jgi:protease II